MFVSEHTKTDRGLFGPRRLRSNINKPSVRAVAIRTFGSPTVSEVLICMHQKLYVQLSCYSYYPMSVHSLFIII